MNLLDRAFQDGRPWTRIGDRFGVTKKPRAMQRPESGAVAFLPMDVIPQGGAYMPTAFVAKASGEITSGTYFERGNVLVAKITPSFENGKQALISSLEQPYAYATTEVIPLHALTDEADPRFLFFYLLHPEVRHYVAERMEGSTGRQRVPERLLLDLPMPDLGAVAQSHAADALELVQVTAAAEDKAIAVALETKGAAMHELFRRGMRGEAQEKTAIGPIPKSWDLVKLGDVRELLQYGTSARCTLEPSNYPVLRIPNVELGRVNDAELKYCDLPAANAERYRLEPGDLLFIRTNGVIDRLGSCAVYDGNPESALFASYLIRARLAKSVLPRFVAYFYGSTVGTSLVAARATPASDGKYNLNTGTIDALPLPLPPIIDEQQEIVDVLDAVDRKIELHRRKRDVLNQLFESLLHKFMTGEVSVDALDLSALVRLEGSAV